MVIATTIIISVIASTTVTTAVITDKIIKRLNGFVFNLRSIYTPHIDVAEQETVVQPDFQSQTIPYTTYPRLAKQVASFARLELHLSTHPSVAEVIQVKEWAFKHMRARNVRLEEIQQLLPIIAKLAFLETRFEREARLMTLTDEFIERQEETATRLFTYQPPSARHWFGRFISEPMPREA